jgi:hypothetical protein
MENKTLTESIVRYGNDFNERTDCLSDNKL